MDFLKLIIYGVIVLFIFAQLDDGTQSKIVNIGRNLKDQLMGKIGEYSQDKIVDEINTLGKLPDGEPCLVDQECIEAFGCSGCECNNQTGECWY